MPKSNHCRMKAAACIGIAEDTTVIWEIRSQYRELARAWDECANEADWIEEQVRKHRAN